MAYLDIEEMTTHIYEEDMNTISHGDDAAMMSAIDAAIEEVQGYLTKYDTGKIFATRGKELTSKCARSDTTGQSNGSKTTRTSKIRTCRQHPKQVRTANCVREKLPSAVIVNGIITFNLLSWYKKRRIKSKFRLSLQKK